METKWNGKWMKNEWKMDQKCQLWMTLINMLSWYVISVRIYVLAQLDKLFAGLRYIVHFITGLAYFTINILRWYVFLALEMIVAKPFVDSLLWSAETAAAAHASFNSSSNSVSTDQIMSTRWSPNIVACVGNFAVAFEDSEDCSGDQATRVAYMRVW